MKPIFLLLLLFLSDAHTAFSQEQATAKSSAPRIEELEKQLKDTFAEFREAIREAQSIGFKYVNAGTASEAFPLSDDFYAQVDEGNKIRERIIPLAEELFLLKASGTDRADDELVHLTTRIMELLYRRGEYSRVYRLADPLVVNNPDNEIANIFLARSAILNNEFGPRIASIFEKHRKYFDESEEVTDTEKLLLTNLELMQKLFSDELEIREAESKTDDLPRVKFTTNKGEFVIELFENEAPQTVANFISLVEAGHYDDMLFHTVISQTAAETGVISDTGVIRNPGYTIYDEFDKPKARFNFSGSVSLNSDKPNSGCCRFFVSLAPLPNFNTKQTVFGRILIGMDTIYRINHTYKIEDNEQIQIEDTKPDKIISAQVLRKRDHEYKPTKVMK